MSRVVQKLLNTNPWLKVNHGIHISCIKMFFTAFEIVQTQNRRTNNVNRNPQGKVTKMKSKFLLINGLI